MTWCFSTRALAATVISTHPNAFPVAYGLINKKTVFQNSDKTEFFIGGNVSGNPHPWSHNQLFTRFLTNDNPVNIQRMHLIVRSNLCKYSNNKINTKFITLGLENMICLVAIQ